MAVPSVSYFLVRPCLSHFSENTFLTTWLKLCLPISHLFSITSLGCLIVLLSRAAITKYHRLGGLSSLFSPGSGGWKSKVEVSAGLVYGKASLPVLQTATSLLCPHMASSLRQMGRNLWCLLQFYKDTSPIRLGPRPYDFM